MHREEPGSFKLLLPWPKPGRGSPSSPRAELSPGTCFLCSSRCRARCNGAKVGEVEREPLIKIKSISNVYENQTQIPSYFNVSCGDGVMENGVIY